MGMLTGGQIRRNVESGELVIKPFNSSMVMPASYDLLLQNRVLASPLAPDIRGTIVVLSDDSPIYFIQPEQMVAVMSAEWMQLPLDICGRFGIRSEYTRKGLNGFGGLQLDPGFRGHLTMTFRNLGPEPVPLTVN